MSSIIKSKKYGSVPCIGDTWHFLQPRWIDISYDEFEKVYEENGKEISEEFYIGIRALMPDQKKRKADGLIVDTYHSREEHTLIHIVATLAEANEIAAEIKANILAYIDVPAAIQDQEPPPMSYKGRYYNDDEYTPMIEKLVFVACEYVTWPGQDETNQIVLSEIFAKVNRVSSRDSKGELINPIIITYDFSEPEEKQRCVYEMPSMQEAITFHKQLLIKLKAQAIHNLQNRLQQALTHS